MCHILYQCIIFWLKFSMLYVCNFLLPVTADVLALYSYRHSCVYGVQRYDSVRCGCQGQRDLLILYRISYAHVWWNLLQLSCCLSNNASDGSSFKRSIQIQNHYQCFQPTINSKFVRFRKCHKNVLQNPGLWACADAPCTYQSTGCASCLSYILRDSKVLVQGANRRLQQQTASVFALQQIRYLCGSPSVLELCLWWLGAEWVEG